MIIITFGFCKFKKWNFFQQDFFFFFLWVLRACKTKKWTLYEKILIFNSKVYFLSYEIARPRNELFFYLNHIYKSKK